MNPRKPTVVRHLVAALTIAAALGSFSDNARACGGGWWPEVNIDYRIQGIARAEKALDAGDNRAAAGAVLRMIPHIRNYKTTTSDSIINRALRVLAVATARSGGELHIKRQIPAQLHDTWLGNNSETRQANLMWSVNTLQAAAKAQKTADPVMQGELGEALAQLDSTRTEGRKLLEKLDHQDLLTSPQAYAVLAKLRASAGDEGGQAAALKRCRAMAKDASMCGQRGAHRS